MSENMNESLLKKITVKGVVGDFLPVTKEKLLIRVWGRAHDMEVVTTPYGESIRFKGMFKSVNPETGEIFRAGECFLPGVAESLLAGAINGAEGNAVEFALDIGVKPDKSTPTGYSYTVKPVVKIEEDTAMLALEEKMGKIALPSPSKK